MGTRARGANATSAFAFEATYGTPPGSGFVQLPLVSETLGEEQGLVADDQIGMGREPLAPSDDVVNNDGDIVVPVDKRAIGYWLKLLLGAPTTTQGAPAAGTVVFSAQPATNATVTINGTLFTFVTTTPTAGQVKIGATLAETVRNLVWTLNASTDANVTPASYSCNRDGTTLIVTHDTIGTGGNSYTLARSTSPASNATVSGATLAGGSTSGPYNHVFSSGVRELPSAAFELGQPEVPSYGMNFGLMADSLSIPMQRSGNLNATIGLIGQGETKYTTTQAGSPTALTIERFAQAIGEVRDRGVPLGNVVSAGVSMSNNLDKSEVIRSDGRIDGADAAKFAVTPQVAVRFADTQLLDYATSKTAIELVFGWAASASQSLTFKVTNVRLPRPKISRQGPGAIQVTYQGQGHRDAITGKSLVVTLVNDVSSYA
jgi:hypothetical protein